MQLSRLLACCLSCLACGAPEPGVPDGSFAAIGRLDPTRVSGLPSGTALRDERLRAEVRHALCTRPGSGFSVPLDPRVSRVALSTGVPNQRAVPVSFAVYHANGTEPVFRSSPQQRQDGWQDHVFDLPTGSRGEALRFESDVSRPAARSDRGACWGSVVFLARDDTRPPNVILVSLDTLGASLLGSFGHSSRASPRIDEFLARSFSFRRAYVQFGNTLVSHRAIFGSRYPSRQDGSETPLAEILADAGYLTLAVTENAYVGSGFGFARGFDRFVDGQGGPGRNIDFQKGATTFETATRWLRELPADTRFFLFVHTYEVHSPYDPTDEKARALADALTPGDERSFPARQLALQMMEHNLGRTTIPGEDLRRYAALHTGEVLQLDALVGRFLDELAALGMDRDTLIVLTSDHGEAFGEDGAVGHGTTLHNRVLHVPLAFHWPERIESAVSEAVAESVDILPTLLGLLQLEVEEPADGRDLSPLLLAEREALEPAAAFAELEPRPELGPAWNGADPCRGGGYAVFTQRFKLFRCLQPEYERLYDLARDPEESADVSGAHPDELARHRALLDDYRAHALRSVPLAPPSVDSAIDEETREQLRALGYAP